MHKTLNAHHNKMLRARIALNVNKITLAMKYGYNHTKATLTPAERKSHYLLSVRHLDSCATYDNYKEKVESMTVRGLI